MYLYMCVDVCVYLFVYEYVILYTGEIYVTNYRVAFVDCAQSTYDLVCIHN